MKKRFLAGIAILLPVTVTAYIIIFLINFLTKPFMGLATKILSTTKIKDLSFFFLSNDQVIKYGSKIIIIIALFLIILGVGYITRSIFINSAINFSDKILHKIPIVNKVYKTTQEIIKTLFITDKNSFKQVVLVPFPSSKTYGLGLVSRISPKTCSDTLNSELISVFIPTTPNPTTGFLLMYKKEDLFFLDMKTEDAIKYVVSCGVIIPPEKIKEKGEIE